MGWQRTSLSLLGFLARRMTDGSCLASCVLNEQDKLGETAAPPQQMHHECETFSGTVAYEMAGNSLSVDRTDH